MIKHIIKIAWSGRRANILLTIEIFFTFCFLAAMITTGLTSWKAWRQPVGFSPENVIDIHFRDLNYWGLRPWAENVVKTQARMIGAARGFVEVEAAGFSWESFYGGIISHDSVGHDGKEVNVLAMSVSDGAMDVLKPDIIRGRPFGNSRGRRRERQLIITERLRARLFDDENPIDVKIRFSGGPTSTLVHGDERVVVGVLSDFKRDGELSKSPYIILKRANLADVFYSRCRRCSPFRHLLIRFKPEATEARRVEIIAKMREIAGSWPLDVSTFEEKRAAKLRDHLAPLVALGVIGVLLMIMVCLGLMGVVWQNVVRRTREIGLRRAHGATMRNIFQQIMGEQLLLATIGILPGVLFMAQAPFLNIVESVDGKSLVVGMVVSAIMMYSITLLASWRPSAMAARIHPAEALHHD